MFRVLGFRVGVGASEVPTLAVLVSLSFGASACLATSVRTLNPKP